MAELTMLDRDLDAAADEVGSTKALAAEALRKAEAARTSGDASVADGWERTARGIAGRLVAAEDRLAALGASYAAAATAVDRARAAESEAAEDLAALEGRRRELLGDLAGAAAADVGLGEVRERVERAAVSVDERVAAARARAELDALEQPQLDPGPDEHDERADAALEGLRRELGDGR